jgi:hypothetical protein
MSYTRNLNLKTDYRYIDPSNNSTIRFGSIDKVIESNFSLTMSSWNELTDEMTESLVEQFDSDGSSGSYGKPIVLTIVGGALLVAAPLYYAANGSITTPIGLSIGGAVVSAIAIVKWVKFHNMRSRMERAK